MSELRQVLKLHFTGQGSRARIRTGARARKNQREELNALTALVLILTLILYPGREFRSETIG